MVVVFPAPLPPSRPTQRPRSISKEIPSTAASEPNRFARFSTLTAGTRNMDFCPSGGDSRHRMAQSDVSDDMQLSAPEQHAPGNSAIVSGRVRLRTLIWIRWIAIIGQLVALFVLRFGLGLPLPLAAALAAGPAPGPRQLNLTLR